MCRELLVSLAIGFAACGRTAKPGRDSLAVSQAASPIAKSAATDTGPTMEQTAAWLMRDAKPILWNWGSDSRIGRRVVDSLAIDHCVMTWTERVTIGGVPVPGGYTVRLGDLDIASIRVRTFADTSSIIELGPRVDMPPVLIAPSKPGGKPDTMRVVALPVRNVDDGRRVVNALKRAAALCGAPASPF